MPIVSNEIVFRMSGGSTNTDPLLSKGGAMSTQAGGVITDNALNNLFPNVSGPQSTNGADHWRCIYIYNSHTSPSALDLTNTKVWFTSISGQSTASSDDEVSMALDPAGVGVDTSKLTTETPDASGTDPGGMTFTTPLSSAAALVPGTIPGGSKYAIWIKRHVNAGASAYTNNYFTVQISGETLD